MSGDVWWTMLIMTDGKGLVLLQCGKVGLALV